MGEKFERILEGAPEDLKRQAAEALIFYASPSRNLQDELAKSAKLRAAFNSVRDWILGYRLSSLNEAQGLFLSTGAVDSSVSLSRNGEEFRVDLVPDAVLEHLEKDRVGKSGRPAWEAPILDVEDKVAAIARGELMGMESGVPRRRRPAKPLGSGGTREKAEARLEASLARARELLSLVESSFAIVLSMGEEANLKAVRLNLEALKKYSLLAGAGKGKTEAESRFLSSVGEKLTAMSLSVSGLGVQLEAAGRELASRAQDLESVFADIKRDLAGMESFETGGEGAPAAVYDAETVAAIRRDADYVSQFIVRGAETAENKNAFSASRILVKDQWRDYEGEPAECLLTPRAAAAAIEKIGRIHVNVFPRDPEGGFVLPPILIEPIRNYVEFFDDRMVMSFVSGETPRKGAKVSFSPAEMQVLRVCGVYLAKDSLYDYRGELNTGTFIGDYSGKVEKRTAVKWTGEKKKFTLASTSSVVDGASRAEAVQDYIDFIVAAANGMPMPQRLSRRKVAVLLRYCTIENLSRTLSLILIHVAQSEPNEARAAILSHIKNEDEAKAAVKKAFEDPQVARACGEWEYFASRLFGKS